MARKIRFIVLASFVSLAGAYWMIGPSAGPINDTTAEAFAGGAEIFAANCARCHGADGKANTAKGKRVEATDFTSDWNRDEARGIRIITNGKGDMPSFKKKIPDIIFSWLVSKSISERNNNKMINAET